MALIGGTATYSGDPATDTKDAVRALIGDTDMNAPKLSDEEILFAISERGGDKYLAGALACRMIGSNQDDVSSKSVGDLSISYGAKSDDWVKRAEGLERLAAMLTSTPVAFAGGISDARRQLVRQDPDRSSPIFEIGQWDHGSSGRWRYETSGSSSPWST